MITYEEILDLLGIEDESDYEVENRESLKMLEVVMNRHNYTNVIFKDDYREFDHGDIITSIGIRDLGFYILGA